MNNFNNDRNPTRRAYNRLITARNLNEIGGSVQAERYLSQFKGEDMKDLVKMAGIIRKSGLEEASRIVHNS
jgi:hypothetical protein